MIWHKPRSHASLHYFEREDGKCLCGRYKKGDRDQWNTTAHTRCCKECTKRMIKKYNVKPAGIVLSAEMERYYLKVKDGKA